MQASRKLGRPDVHKNDPYAALGAVGIADKSGLYDATTKGGMLYVFAI